MEFDVILRRVGGSFIITVPIDVVRAYHLDAGDSVRWNLRGDETKIQFFRVMTNKVPAERELETAQ
jgi:hypothetical protein